MLRWFFLSSLLAWLSLIAPPLVLLSWLAEFTVWPWLFGSVLLAPLVARIVLGIVRSGQPWQRWIAVQTLGLGSLLLPLIPAGLLLQAVLPAGQVGLIALLAWAGIGLYAAWRAQRIHDNHLEIRSGKLKQPLCLVQLSDVHVGSRSGAFLQRVMQQAALHNPDLLVITGDLIDTGRVQRADLAALAMLDCPRIMCIGNHERYVPLNKAIDDIESTGVKVLRDAALEIGPLRVIGLDDRDRPDELHAVLSRIATQDSRFAILLYHRPDGWAAARHFDIELTLSGHTHGGQIWPFGYLVQRQYPELTGLHQREGKSLYVSSGTGTWGPTFRLGTRAEITVIDLLPEPAATEVTRAAMNRQPATTC